MKTNYSNTLFIDGFDSVHSSSEVFLGSPGERKGSLVLQTPPAASQPVGHVGQLTHQQLTSHHAGSGCFPFKSQYDERNRLKKGRSVFSIIALVSFQPWFWSRWLVLMESRWDRAQSFARTRALLIKAEEIFTVPQTKPRI